MTRLAELAVLWRRERRAAQERFAAQRDTVLRDLHVAETGAVAGGRLLLWVVPRRPVVMADTRLGPGDPVRLWVGDDGVAATVARRRDDRLAVVIDGEPPEWIEDGRFHLDRSAPMTTFDRGDRAIERFPAAPLAAVVAGDARPRFASAPRPWRPLDGDLHAAQLAAVDSALAADDVALIHGPPGTGKTRTLVEIVRQAVARGDRVLCTAASNTAVDNLAERLAACGVDAVRLGHPARVAPAVEALTLDARLEADDAWALARAWLAEAAALRRRKAWHEARALERDARRHLAATEDAILARARVICATCAGSELSLPFDLVVLDEATQAPDPLALCALARAPRAVLAGDPRQLPPTVLAPDAAGLQRTIFEDLAARAPDAVTLLVEQHRMHEALMAFPSRSQYGGRLVAAPAVARHTLADLGVTPDGERPDPLVFIDTAGRGLGEERTGDDPSTRNPGHAALAAGEVRRLLARGVAPADVAVITPYDAQARLVRELLAGEGVEIGTVDGFQGREKEAIVVDLVRSNDDGELGFLADTRRMNVALTRARRCLIVIGDGATLGGHPYYAAFMASAEAAGAWLSAWAVLP